MRNDFSFRTELAWLIETDNAATIGSMVAITYLKEIGYIKVHHHFKVILCPPN